MSNEELNAAKREMEKDSEAVEPKDPAQGWQETPHTTLKAISDWYGDPILPEKRPSVADEGFHITDMHYETLDMERRLIDQLNTLKPSDLRLENIRVGADEGMPPFEVKPPLPHKAINIGSSDYSKHTIQPWDIWREYKLDPWDADIIKRVLRNKEGDDPALDYEKIKHICDEKLAQLRGVYD